MCFSIYLDDFFHIKLIVNKRGAPEAPPTYYPFNFMSQKYENIYKKYEQIYKNDGMQISPKAKFNQPYQAHQPWQSNSLTGIYWVKL